MEYAVLTSKKELERFINTGMVDVCDLHGQDFPVINGGAFSADETIKSVKLSQVTEIRESAFENCKSLENVVIEKNVAKDSKNEGENLTIQHNAFKNCHELQNVVIRDYKSVTIESGAFSGCPKLRSLVLGEINDTIEIHHGAFPECNKDVFEIFVNGDNDYSNLETSLRENDIKLKKYDSLKPIKLEDTESEDTESEDTESEAVESEAIESEDAESEAAESEAAESEAVESEAVESEDAESEDAESEDAESEAIESEDAESEDAESEAVESEDAK